MRVPPPHEFVLAREKGAGGVLGRRAGSPGAHGEAAEEGPMTDEAIPGSKYERLIAAARDGRPAVTIGHCAPA